MKNVIIAGLILLSGTGTALAGSGNYINELSNGTWANGIQAQTASSRSLSPENHGNYINAIVDGSWFQSVPQQYVTATEEVPNNTIRALADGDWFATFNSSPVADARTVR